MRRELHTRLGCCSWPSACCCGGSASGNTDSRRPTDKRRRPHPSIQHPGLVEPFRPFQEFHPGKTSILTRGGRECPKLTTSPPPPRHSPRANAPSAKNPRSIHRRFDIRFKDRANVALEGRTRTPGQGVAGARVRPRERNHSRRWTGLTRLTTLAPAPCEPMLPRPLTTQCRYSPPPSRHQARTQTPHETDRSLRV